MSRDAINTFTEEHSYARKGIFKLTVHALPYFLIQLKLRVHTKIVILKYHTYK